jgi:hypothetical protein
MRISLILIARDIFGLDELVLLIRPIRVDVYNRAAHPLNPVIPYLAVRMSTKKR